MIVSDSHELGRRLVEQVRHHLEEAALAGLPDLRLPRVFAGHPVDGMASAAMINALSSLGDLGVGEVAGIDLRARVVEEIERLDPDDISGFASLFVAESVERLGLEQDVDLDRVCRAVRSPTTTEQVRANQLPPNWTVVAARCLAAEASLTGVPPPELAEFLDRARHLFENSHGGWINDGMAGGTHYDIYTPDLYLLAEPLAPELGAAWTGGLARVLEDLDSLAQPGGAIVWGRSIGALGLALTAELAGLAVRHDVTTRSGTWLERARQASVQLGTWFPFGLVATDMHRASDFYRGPASRLPLTFDLHAKLLRAAATMLSAPAEPLADVPSAWAPVNRFIGIGDEGRSGVWGVRSVRQRLRFVLPLQWGWTTDYLPSLRAPGLFECPTNGHPCFLPVVDILRDGAHQRLVPAGLPTEIEHHADRTTIVHEGWGPGTQTVDEAVVLGGVRRASHRVAGSTLRVDEMLEFADTRDLTSVSVLVPETADRPLDVAVTGAGAAVRTIDTDGLPDWRSYWSSIARVHQIEVPVAKDVRFSWEVRPQIRVASTLRGVAYDQLLYEPLTHRIRCCAAPRADLDNLAHELADIDVLHLGWPEWWSGTDPSHTERVVRTVIESGVSVVWTQHNLLPHADKSDRARACYQLWAEAAHGVIHHSHWGEEIVRDAYAFSRDAQHVVIPHGHWGPRYAAAASQSLRPSDRAEIEKALGWSPCGIRLAVLGSSRPERDLQLVLDGFHASRREDLQLVVRVDGDETIPDDPRIVAERGPIEESEFFWRNGAIDALVLPITRPGMLTTGTAFDAIGGRMAPITSDWGFFDETFRGSDIRFGSTVDDLRRCLDSLTVERVERCRESMDSLRERYDWSSLAEKTLEFIERLVGDPTRQGTGLR